MSLVNRTLKSVISRRIVKSVYLKQVEQACRLCTINGMPFTDFKYTINVFLKRITNHILS